MFKINIIRSWLDPEAARRIILAEAAFANLRLAEFVAERARFHCPYDHSKPPGELHLRDTIQVISEADGLSHHVIATAPWAEPVEFGYTHWRSKRRIPPVAYMRKAVREGANEFPRIIGDARVRQGYHGGRVMGVTFSAA